VVVRGVLVFDTAVETADVASIARRLDDWKPSGSDGAPWALSAWLGLAVRADTGATLLVVANALGLLK